MVQCRTEVESSRARLRAVRFVLRTRKGLAVLSLSLIGVMTFDLVGAGATTPGPTITSTVSCGTGTTCTATYTIFNTSALPLAFAVLYGPTPAGCRVNNFPTTVPGNSASAFTVTGITRSAKTYSIDILVGHATGQAFTDLPGGGTMPGNPSRGNMPGEPSQISLSLLAFTGADLGALVIAGAALISGGWLLVRTSHRRRLHKVGRLQA
jgi:hypothetical protein